MCPRRVPKYNGCLLMRTRTCLRLDMTLSSGRTDARRLERGLQPPVRSQLPVNNCVGLASRLPRVGSAFRPESDEPEPGAGTPSESRNREFPVERRVACIIRSKDDTATVIEYSSSIGNGHMAVLLFRSFSVERVILLMSVASAVRSKGAQRLVTFAAEKVRKASRGGSSVQP